MILILKQFYLQVTILNTNNYKVKWFEVFLSNINNSSW